MFFFSGNLKMDSFNRSFDYSFSVDSPIGLNQGFLLNPDNAIDSNMSSIIPDTPRYEQCSLRKGHRAILKVHNTVSLQCAEFKYSEEEFKQQMLSSIIYTFQHTVIPFNWMAQNIKRWERQMRDGNHTSHPHLQGILSLVMRVSFLQEM